MKVQGISPISLAAAVLAGVALLNLQAAADSNCHCDRYKDLLPPVSLASDVAAIGANAVDSAGGQYARQQELRDAYRLRIDSNDQIPAECKDYLKSQLPMPRVDLTLRYPFERGPRPNYSYDSSYADSLSSAYSSYYYGNFLNPLVGCSGSSGGASHIPGSGSIVINGTLGGGTNGGTVGGHIPCKPHHVCEIPANGNDAGANATYVNCLAGRATSAWSDFQHTMAQDPSAIAAQMSASLGSPVSVDAARIISAYNHLLQAPSATAMLAQIRQGRDGLSNDEFLIMVQMYGLQFGNGYDFKRIDSSQPQYNGSVGGTPILQSAFHNTLYGVQVNGQPDYNGPDKALAEYAGVCRDIASLQGQMLEAKGFKHVYVISHELSNDYHVTVVAQYPDRHNTMAVLNYDGLSIRRNVDGSVALYQTGTDSAMNDFAYSYRIYHPGGGFVADVPSEMTKFLSEAAGFDIKTLDGLARPAPELEAANVGVDQNRHLELRAFTGTDNIGARYSGAAATVNWGQGTAFPGRAGIVLAEMHRPGAIYNGTNSETVIAYGQIEQHAVATLHQSQSTSVVLDTSVTGLGGIHHIVAGPDSGDTNEGGDYRAGTELRVEHGGPGDRLHATVRAGATLVVDTRDVRDATPSNWGPYLGQAYAGAAATLRMRDATLYGDVLAVGDALGVRGRADLGVAGRNIAATAYVTGRLTDGTSLYEDNSLRRAGVNVTIQPTRHITVGVTGEIPIESDSPILDGITVMGNGTIHF